MLFFTIASVFCFHNWTCCFPLIRLLWRWNMQSWALLWFFVCLIGLAFLLIRLLEMGRKTKLKKEKRDVWLKKIFLTIAGVQIYAVMWSSMGSVQNINQYARIDCYEWGISCYQYANFDLLSISARISSLLLFIGHIGWEFQFYWLLGYSKHC